MGFYQKLKTEKQTITVTFSLEITFPSEEIILQLLFKTILLF